jgi:hypothetical protein
MNRYSACNASKDTYSDQLVVEERYETNEKDVGISRHAQTLVRHARSIFLHTRRHGRSSALCAEVGSISATACCMLEAWSMLRCLVEGRRVLSCACCCYLPVYQAEKWYKRVYIYLSPRAYI